MVVVTGGSAKFTLTTMPVEDYPTLPEMPGVSGTVGSDAFAAAARRAVEVEITRFVDILSSAETGQGARS